MERTFRLDVIDRGKAFLVRGELPGVEKDDEREEFYRHELGYGKFMRTIALPEEVDVEKIHAELKDGILEIELPKIRAAEWHTVKVA